MKKYYERILDKILKEELEAFGAVLITGPKWSGKSTTAKKIAKTIVNLQDPFKKESYINMIDLNPYLILEGEKPLLIDEWQEAPVLWDAIRHDVDNKNEKGLYILTGSQKVDSSKISHSGAGRISRILMRTMSLYESKASNGKVSIEDLFKGAEFEPTRSKLSIEDIANLIVKGGFPSTIDETLSVARKQVRGYMDIIASVEIFTVDGIKRDSNVMFQVLRSLARNTSTQVTDVSLIKDIEVNNFLIHRNTLSSYINVLKDLYIIEDLKAWNPKLRSKSAIRTSDTRHFIDPSIPANLLDAGPEDIIRNVNTFGLLFESLVVRDLRVYADFLNGKVFHYRDSSGLEVDSIIHLDNGKWAAIEIKLGTKELDKAAENLIKLKNVVDIKLEPSFLMIITGGEFAYKRPDGVFVVPIGCLKP